MTWPIVKLYFRSEVRGLYNIPRGGALVVSNHSGDLTTPDMSVFAVAYYARFGYRRPLYVLAHDNLFSGPAAGLLRRTGIVRATRANASAALAAGATLLDFPGGDYDVYRPSGRENVIDFGGRTGYVRTAIDAGVPIVPSVSIGAQETQLYLARGVRLSRLLKLTGFERRHFRTDILPVAVGFPFGLSVVLPVNLPLPVKIVTLVLPPVDVAALFGPDPDVAEVDAHVRAVMQRGMDRLARRRRLPILG